MARTRVPVQDEVKVRKPHRKPTRAALAGRGKVLADVRMGTPLLVEAKLRDMEAAGLISDGIVNDADDVAFESSEGEPCLDCDIDFADEDAFEPLDCSRGGRQTVVCGSGEWGMTDTAFDSVRKFAINVNQDMDGYVSCSVEKDMRTGFDHDSPEAADVLNELVSRYDVLSRFGDWLAVDRQAFLKTGDWWDFAEKSLEETAKNQSSVVQADLIEIAQLGCREDAFSRFSRNAVLSWGRRGSVDVGFLFSKEARCAWVARGYLEFCKQVNVRDMESALKTLKDCVVERKVAVDRRKISLMSMSLKRVAVRLCSLANVKGRDVEMLYGRRMLEV